MIYQYNDRVHVTQPRERQIGEALPTQTQQRQTSENAASSVSELEELVEQVCWEMRHEPTRERGRGGLAW